MKLWDFDAFIFDLDGTLIDSGKYHSRAFADAVFAQSGYQLTSSEHHEFFASHSSHFSDVLNARHGLQLIPEQVLEQKRQRVHEIFVAELFPGVREFLEIWKDKKPMALATNSPLSFVQPALEAADAFHYFKYIATADDVIRRKPDPEIIEICLKRLNVASKNTLVFEDQMVGIESARNAGTHVVAVDNGQPVFYPVDIAVYSWNELLKLSEMC